MDGRLHRTARRARTAAALAAAVAAASVLAGAQPGYGVAAGSPATDGRYGFVAHLQIGTYERACTGALVDAEWVVTAGACFPGGQAPTRVTVGGVRTVTEVVRHPDRDVALVKLDRPVTTVAPVAISATAPAAGESLEVAGFGRTATDWVPDRLHTTTFDVLTVDGTGIELAGAVCKGDAGGPAFRVRADGTADLVAVHSASNQAGCVGVAAGGPGRTVDTRLDTVAGWIGDTVRGGSYVRFATGVNVLDTRSGVGARAGERAADSVTTFPVTGVGSVPASGVTAVLVDVTVLTGDSATYATVFPAGATRPTPLTSVHARAAQIASNTAIVDVGTGGRLSVWTASGGVNLVVDVQGYFTRTPGTGGRYVPVRPTTLVDTRDSTPLAAGASRTVQIAGGVIPAGTTTAYLNLIAVGATARGYLATHPTASSSRSVLNYLPSGNTAHGVTARLSADGRATFTNGGSAPVNLVITAGGYYTPDVAGGGQRTMTARRVLDTRSDGSKAPIAARGTIDVPLGLPAGSVAAVNLIVVGNADSGYLRAWAAGGAEPSTSLANYPATGAAGPRSAAAMVPVGADGTIRVRNVSDGTTHLVVDLQSWHAAP